MSEDYTLVAQRLSDSQRADHDGRERARIADHFANKEDGQWEPSVVKQYGKKPKYTFDKVNSVIADICGEMNSMDFDSKVRPAGGGAEADIAMHYDGLIRSIENSSKAKYIYRSAGRQMVTSGIGGWRIITGYRESTSFQQDLIVKGVSNFMDRVWFDAGAEERDMSDSDYGFILTSMTMEDYKRDFPEGTGFSIGRDKDNNVYSYKKENEVVICEYYYKKRESAEIVLMSNGAVYLVDDDFEAIKDELADQQIVEEGRRKTEQVKVFHKIMDGKDFITKETETVFDYIPLVPCFANFEISEDKVIYWGVVEKIMDPQRVLNYAESRKIEEGALAPRAKTWMTKEQAAGHVKSLETQNTNSDPIQLYTHVPDQPPPFPSGGAMINQGLAETAQAMQQHILSTTSRMDPSREGQMGLQSGVALEMLQNKGDNVNYEYFNAMEIAISHSCKIMVNAVPLIYDTKQELRLDQQDGTSKTVTIKEPILDEETGKMVEINDLSLGQYSVTCDSGPAFHNRQQETVKALTEIAAIDPSIIQIGSDVLLSSIPTPGMDKIAKRKRAMMVKEGIIPEDEMTDEEKEMIQQINQAGQQPSAMDQALLATAEAEQKKADAMTQDILSKIQERDAKLQLELIKMNKENQQMMMDNQGKQQDRMFALIQAQDTQLKTQAETLKIIKDALGADAIISNGGIQTFNQQTERLSDTQRTAE